MVLGERLRGLREKRGLSGRAAATYLGISAAHVSDMEGSKAFPSLDLLTRLARFYQTSTDYLLGLTEDPAPPVQWSAPPLGIELWQMLRELPDEGRAEVLRFAEARVEAQRRQDEELRNRYIGLVEAFADSSSQDVLARALAAVRSGDKAGAFEIIDLFFSERSAKASSNEASDDV